MEAYQELLEAWVKLSTVLRNDKYIESMSFNEILICRLLNEQENVNGDFPYLQVKDLCEKTKMLKAAVNRILNVLENNNYIERRRFNDNRKNVYISLTDNGRQFYYQEHSKILDIVKQISQKLGSSKTKEVANTLKNVSDAVEEYWIESRKTSNE